LIPTSTASVEAQYVRPLGAYCEATLMTTYPFGGIVSVGTNRVTRQPSAIRKC
jgi:hypothetical protein